MKKMRIRKAGIAFLLVITMLISTNGVALCANTLGTLTTGSEQKSITTDKENLGNLLPQEIEKYHETPSQESIEVPILESDKREPVKEYRDTENTEISVDVDTVQSEENQETQANDIPSREEKEIEANENQPEIEEEDQNNLNRASREVNVSTSEELQAALSNAQPGDEIILAPGEYLGITPLSNWAWFYSAKNGTQESPITVRSADPGNKAVLKGAGTLSQASVLRIRNADYWIIKDIVCANAQRGITLDASNYSQIIGCEVHSTGSEGIQIRDNSSHNLVENCKVTNTGQVSPGFGEGIYIGSYYGDWTKYGKECDYNTVRGCYLGPGVAAEHVDIKEGTTGNVVEYCVFDATGMSGQNYADSFVDLQGNDATIRYNIGYRNDNPSFNAAFQVHRMVNGWGINNMINGNEVWLDNQIPYLIDSSQSGTSAIVEIPNIRHPETGNKYLGNVTEVQTTTIDIEVTKIWVDENNQDGKRPINVQIQLYQMVDGTKSAVGSAVILNESNSWSNQWNSLPKSESGKTIAYSVEEVSIPTDYVVSYADDGAGNLTITNSYTPEKTSVTGQKIWMDQDNQDGKRPSSITVNLLANGNKVTSQQVEEADNWSYEFKDLPKYEDGDLITYTVTEDAVSGYTTQINGTNLTNTYAPRETSRTVTKVWNDSKNQDGKRPEAIQVQLYKTVNEVKSEAGETETLSPGNSWSHTWSSLPEMESGHVITYSVEEVKVPTGYTVTYTDDGVGNITIINSYTLETTNKSVQIVWDDEKNQDGKRPMSMNVQLLADGVEKGETIILNAANNWEHTWTGLDKYQAGQEIVYTLKEISMIDGYLTSYSTDTFTITNSHIPEVVEKEVSKVWDDADNQYGKRPDSIEVQLLADGVESGEVVTLDDSNHWKYTFVGLDKYKAGQEIAYTMIEKTNTAEYSTTYSSDTFTITNSYTPRETSKTVIYVWDDADNQDGKRPDSMEVQLFADGMESGAPIMLSAENNWRYTWTGLPEEKDGKAITYIVKETSIVEGYTVTYSDDTFTITNSYRPETVVQSVSKVWADNNNESGKRPESIQVQLFANGEAHGDNITLSKTNNWKHTWTELDKYENGVLIHYTVKETAVSEYYIMSKEEKAEETIITNTYRKSAAASDDKTDSKTANYINKHVAKTGDETNILNLLILLILSGGILASVGIRRKRKN